MTYDFYTDVSPSGRARIISAQQQLYRKVLNGITFATTFEVGPGYGGFAEFCSQRNVAYRGLELNPTLAEALRRKGHHVDCGPATELPGDLEKVDLILLSHVIEHLGRHQDVAAVLRNLFARLAPGGHLALLFPDVYWSPRPFNSDYTHAFPTTLVSVVRLCTDLGGACVRQGHYVGRFLKPWKLLWLVHELMPTCILPGPLAGKLAHLFSAHAYCIVQPVVKIENSNNLRPPYPPEGETEKDLLKTHAP